MERYVVREPDGKVTEIQNDFWEAHYFRTEPKEHLKFESVQTAWERLQEESSKIEDDSDYGIDHKGDIYQLHEGRISLFGTIEKLAQ